MTLKNKPAFVFNLVFTVVSALIVLFLFIVNINPRLIFRNYLSHYAPHGFAFAFGFILPAVIIGLLFGLIGFAGHRRYIKTYNIQRTTGKEYWLPFLFSIPFFIATLLATVVFVAAFLAAELQ